MPTSNIDDLLMGGKSNIHPETPEHVDANNDNKPMGDIDGDAPDYGEDETESNDESIENNEGDEKDSIEEPEKEYDEDEYGNTKERMSKGMKERLDRKEKQHQREIEQREIEINNLRSQLKNEGASREVQQAAKDFEYDPESSGDWQQQLASFVKQTVSSMSREEAETRQRHEDAQLQHEFESKFKTGMEKFSDFSDVVSALPFQISNPMTLATRAMADPAAFLYAAAKRQPAELERISKIRDPYAQMTEMGRLEERMRKNKPTTSAPRPLGRTTEDSTGRETKKKTEPTIEDLIARADAKKLAKRKVAPMRGRR